MSGQNSLAKVSGREPTITTFLVFVATTFYIVVGRAFTWLDPAPSETQTFAYIGSAWLHGDVPYMRGWEMKPPGIFAVNAAVFAFFPDSFGALAVVEGVCMLGCAITLYLLLRQWQVSPIGCWLGVLIFGITSNLVINSNVTEIYLYWPATLSMFFFSKALPELRCKGIFLSGLFAGIASLFKLTGLAPLLAQFAFMCLLWVVFRRFSFRRLVGVLSVALAGVAMAWLPVGLYFGWHGALVDLINVSFVYPFNYSAAIPKSLSRYFHMTVHFLVDLYMLYMLIVFIFIGFCAHLFDFEYFLRQRDDMRFDVTSFYILSALWVLADFGAALAGNRSQAQYFLPLTLSIAAMVALTYSRQVETNGVSKRLRLFILAFLVFPLIVTHVNKELREMVHLIRYGHLFSHDAELGHDKPTMTAAVKQIAMFVDDMRKKDDTLFSWDYYPLIFQTLHIKSPVFAIDMTYRHFFSGDLRPAFVKRVLRELRSHPPTFIIMDSPNDSERNDPMYLDFFTLVDEQYECLREFKLPYNAYTRLYKNYIKMRPGISHCP